MKRSRGLLAATSAAAALVVAAASSTSASAVRLVEATTCARPTPLPAVTDARTDGVTLVSFAVTNQARLRLDARGVLTAASTNTGCRPRTEDTVVVVPQDGSIRAATADEIALAVTSFHSGDWREPGVWHAAG